MEARQLISILTLNRAFHFNADKNLQRMADMSEKVAVATFIIVAFQAEGRPAMVSAVLCAVCFLLSLALTNRRTK